MSTLAQAGYLDVRKTSGRRRRTLVCLSADGRRAFEVHVAALENLIAGARAGAAETVGQGDLRPLPESGEQVRG